MGYTVVTDRKAGHVRLIVAERGLVCLPDKARAYERQADLAAGPTRGNGQESLQSFLGGILLGILTCLL